MAWAVDNFGNAGRSFCESAMLAGREIYNTRRKLPGFGPGRPPLVAFTSSSTESLNLVIGGLVKRGRRYNDGGGAHSSCARFTLRTARWTSSAARQKRPADGRRRAPVEAGDEIMIVTHGSNVTGNVTDIAPLYEFPGPKLTLILDVSQTLGLIPVRRIWRTCCASRATRGSSAPGNRRHRR